MDPHGRGTPPMDISPHVVTTSHFGWNHSFIWMASGNPIVLHGLHMVNGNWNRLHKTIRDVSIFTVPTYHDSEMGMARGNNTVFVVRMDGICVAHLGDLGHLLNETQVKMMGKIDVLFVPLGQGGYRISSEDALKIVAAVKPKIVIPYHYGWEGYAEEFAQGFRRVRNMEGNGVRLSKANLKAGTEIIVLRDVREELDEDTRY
jgi:L-ascorbate metabolism protein UlaG (beta-lactamase superfamily)